MKKINQIWQKVIERVNRFFEDIIKEIEKNYTHVDWVNKGNSLRKQYKYDEAIKAFEKAIELKPDYEVAWYYKGIAYSEANKADESIESFDHAIKLKPNDAYNYNGKGNVYFNIKKYDYALEAYNKAIELIPDNSIFWKNKADALTKLEKYDDAIVACDKSIELDPNYASAWNSKGIVQIELDKYEDAIQSIENAIKLDPKREIFWDNKADALRNLNKFEEALLAYDKAIQLDPKYAYYWNRKGDVFTSLGKYEEALKTYDKAIQINPKIAYFWADRARALSNLDKFRDAIDSYLQAIQLDAANSTYLNNLGVAYSNIDDDQEAIDAYDKALEIKADKIVTLNNKAISLFNLKKYQESLQTINKVDFYLQLSDLDEATTAIDNALSKVRDNKLLIMMKGQTEIEKEDYSSAIESFKSAYKSDLGNPEYLMWYIYAQFLAVDHGYDIESKIYQHRITAIIRMLEKVCNLLQTHKQNENLLPWITNTNQELYAGKSTLEAKILYFKGYCYYKLKDYDKAIEKFIKCSRIDSLNKMKSREALLLIWKSKINPSIWRWWWNYPINPWPKRIISTALALSFLGLIFLHPFIESILNPFKINWTVYIIFTVAILVILLLPHMEKVKISEIEFSLSPQTTLEPILSPISFEKHLKAESK